MCLACDVIFVLDLCSFWVVSKHKKKQAGLCFVYRGNVSHREQPSVMWDGSFYISKPVTAGRCSNEMDRQPCRKASLIWTVPGCCFHVCYIVRCCRDVACLRNGVSRSWRAVEADILNWQCRDLERWWSWRSWLHHSALGIKLCRMKRRGQWTQPGETTQEQRQIPLAFGFMVDVYYWAFSVILDFRFLQSGMCMGFIY